MTRLASSLFIGLLLLILALGLPATLPAAVATGGIQPYPSAPACPTHDPHAYHKLWDYTRGCHYDLEHGTMNFAVAATKFGVDLTQFTVWRVSYPWQTFTVNGTENDLKHGGYKWTYQATNQQPCTPGEVGTNGTDGYAVEFHARGDGPESLGHIHSSFVAVVVCNAQHSGTLITGGWQDYGERVSPYQGVLLNLPDQPQPPYNPGISPYLALGCRNDDGQQADCAKVSTNNNFIWVSRPQAQDSGHRIAQLLLRGRDAMQLIAGSTRTTSPGGFVYICGGATFVPAGCKMNNTTGMVHQVFGNVPSEWDTLDGMADGLVTYQGYTDRWGNVQPVGACSAQGLDCVPLYLAGVPVGGFSTFSDNVTNTPTYLPERDIFFCNSAGKGLPAVWVACAETAPGAVPSGWIGVGN